MTSPSPVAPSTEQGLPVMQDGSPTQRWTMLRTAIINDRLDDARRIFRTHGLDDLPPLSDDEPIFTDAMVRRVLALLADQAQRLDVNDPVVVPVPSMLRGLIGSGETPLHWALAGNRPDLLAWLLDRGADPGRPNDLGETVTAMAHRMGPQLSIRPAEAGEDLPDALRVFHRVRVHREQAILNEVLQAAQGPAPLARPTADRKRL